MDSDKGSNSWTCKNCGNEFTPQPPNYSCPSCGSAKTVPNKNTKTMKLIDELHKQEEAARESAREARERLEEDRMQRIGTQLCQHLQSIGVDANIINQVKGIELETNEKTRSNRSTIAVVDVEGRNISEVQVIYNLQIHYDAYSVWTSNVHRYVIDGVASGFGEEFIGDTVEVKQGIKWVKSSRDPLRSSLNRLLDGDRVRKEDALVYELNSDVGLNAVLYGLGLSPDLLVYVGPDDGKLGVIYRGMGENQFEYMTRDVFDTFDKLAGHVKNILVM